MVICRDTEKCPAYQMYKKLSSTSSEDMIKEDCEKPELFGLLLRINRKLLRGEVEK